MADSDDDTIIGTIASGETLPKVIDALGQKEHSLFVPALRAVGNILTTNDEDLIDRAIFEEVLDKLLGVLHASNSNLIKEACWALSNITAGPHRHI